MSTSDSEHKACINKPSVLPRDAHTLLKLTVVILMLAALVKVVVSVLTKRT
jgi:hypothetical protein